ncbi:MAG: hypothetical protein FWB97_09400 [Oscillospiraceae bacterium]|nr:hypothetical protein [Oscillospiraceae bacterium]
MISNNFNVSNTNWWSNASTRNPGIGTWTPLANRVGNNPFGQNAAGTSQAFRDSVVQLTETSRALSQALSSIRGMGNTPSPMQARRPVSENTDAMTINSFDPNRLRGAGASDFSVDILQVAQAQRNEGASLQSNARAADSGFTTGAHQISINVGNRQFDINFNVSAGDTNRDVQQRIATAINNRNDIGVRATVETGTGSAAGTSSLVLESARTGVDRAGSPNFTVSSGSGNAVAMTGVGETTQQAQDAQFRVNRGFTGALQTSRTNDVDLGFGMTAQLRETGNVQVDMGRDVISQQNAFRHMVNTFNDLVSTARDAGRTDSNLQNELAGIVRSSASALERIGISLNQNGRMQIDEARMAAAAESGELERFADSREGFNFMSRLNRTAESVGRNPAAHADTSQEMSVMGGFGGGNADFMSGGFNFTPMQSMMMTRFMNIGMLFDSFM